MAAPSPETIHEQWQAAINTGDLAATVALYEPEATAMPQPGRVVHGADAIREDLRGLLALQPRYEMRLRQVLRTGDVALVLSDWTMRATAGGSPLELTGTTSDVVRRQPDDSWRFLISNPTGTATPASRPDA